MKRFILASLLSIACLMLATMLVSGQDTGVTAEALGTANLRAEPSIDAALVGEISVGTQYPIIGRSEFYPWVLLGEVGSFAPKGWVFQDLVTIRGNINAVPFSSVNVLDQPTAPLLTEPADAPSTSPGSGGATATLMSGVQVTPGVGNEQPIVTPFGTPTPSPQPTIDARVFGTVLGEINVRYGPGTNYQVVGRAFAGETFAITGYHTTFPWLRVSYADSPNGSAWIARDLLDVTGDVFSTAAIATTTFNLPTLTPTPAARASSSIPGQAAVPISPAFSALGDNLWNFILSRQFVPETSQFGALYLQDLQTGEAITYGSEFAFSGTSINKIAILMAYFGTLDGTPNFAEARDIANTMICSENVATNRMLEYVGLGDMLFGADVTTDFMRRLGASRTFLTAPFDTTTALATATPIPRAPEIPQTDADQEKSNPNPTNQMTVEEMGWMLSNVYQCAYNESGPLITDFGNAFTPQECRKMLYVMSENTVDGLLKAGAPANIRVAHKHGWVNDTHGNAGIFFTPGGDYIMVMMLHKPEFLSFSTESLPTLAETSRLVYNFYNPTLQLPEVREGYIPGPDECNYTSTDPLVENLANPTFLLNNDPALFYSANPANVGVETPSPTPSPTASQIP